MGITPWEKHYITRRIKMYFRWISTHFLPDPHNVWQTSINWFVSRIFLKLFCWVSYIIPLVYSSTKDFPITRKTFVEEYTIPSHIAKSSLGEIKLFNCLDRNMDIQLIINILDPNKVQKWKRSRSLTAQDRPTDHGGFSTMWTIK